MSLVARAPERHGRDEARWGAGALVMAVALAYGVAVAPFITMGLVLGGVLMIATLARPVVVLGVMLAIGAVDLSFVTAGAVLQDWGGIDMNGVRLIGMVAAMSAIVALEGGVFRRLTAPDTRWYVLFLGFGALTLGFSPVPLDGARLLLKLAYPLLVFLAVLTVARRREDLERLMDWTLAGAVFVALVMVPVLLALGAYAFTAGGRLEAQGGALHQNGLSFYMLLMMVIALTRFAVRAQHRYLALAGLFGLVLILTQTRITLLALVVTFGAASLFMAWRGKDYRLPLGALLVGLLVGLPLLPIVLERTFGTIPDPGELWALLTDPVELYHRMNLQGREIIWYVVGQAFLANPVFGTGLGTSTAYVVATLDPSSPGVVHNEYLRLAADTGLIGIVLFAAAMMAWLLRALRDGARPGLVREYALPAVAGIVAWAVVALTDNPFDYYSAFTQYIGFLAAGAAILSETA
jgi:O-antigen ligase